jgi:hypothetical protein
MAVIVTVRRRDMSIDVPHRRRYVVPSLGRSFTSWAGDVVLSVLSHGCDEAALSGCRGWW